MGDPGAPPQADETVDQLLQQMRGIVGDCIETYSGLAKRGIQALSGDEAARQTWFRDAWMTWAGLAGHAVEAGYIAAALADQASGAGRPRG